MKKRYMIVRILNIIAEMKESNAMITERCYNIIDTNYGCLDAAYRVKEGYREPSNYIVVEYWK
jgi:hypothetical protein